MGSLRPLSTRAQRHFLRWRTRRGRTTAIRYLDVLAVALQAKGYRCVRLYQAGDLPTRPPILWIFAFGLGDHVRVAITVGELTTPDGSWAKVSKTAKVEHGGPSDLWTQVEKAHAWWTDRGRLGVEAFRVTVVPEGGHFWFSTPDGEAIPAR